MKNISVYKFAANITVCLLFLFTISTHVKGQAVLEGPVLTCPALEQDMHTLVDPPLSFLKGEPNPGNTNRSTFIVTYHGFPAEARQAFQYAINIWQSILISSVPIRMDVSWSSLEEGTLGSAGATSLYRDFEGATRKETWYPVALAESLAERELNSTTEPDIAAIFNSDVNWYYGTSGSTPARQYSLVTVALHEIAHGLGFFSSFNVENNVGTWGEENYAFIYDAFIENRNNQRLLNTGLFPKPSATLARALTSNNLYFDSSVVPTNNRATNPSPRLYAPEEFTEGSSISHLDEITYPSGNPNSLMSPQIGRAESIFWPGDVTISMLRTIGWIIRLPNIEEGPVVVFPNPTEGVLTIDALFEDEVEQLVISVTDALGKQIMLGEHTGAKRYFSEHLNLSHLPAGLYIVHVSTPDDTYSKKIMVSR